MVAGSIRDWLEYLGLNRYVEKFEENDLDLDVVTDLSDSDLEKLGVLSMGHRKKLLRAIELLRAQPASPDNRTEGAVIVGEPLSTPSAKPVEAERRQLTVMFCDLVDSTALSTELDPEDLQDVIRGYQDTVTKIIREFDGFVAKYMGDAVLAYFGYPQAHEDDAGRSVRAGLDIVWSMVGLNAEIGKRHEIELAVRVGITTGLVVVGDIVGEGASEEASVIGETPNVAARLQGLAQPNQVVIGPLTRELIGGAFVCKDLGAQSLKGIAEPVRAWNVLDEADIDSGEQVERVEGELPMVGRDEELGLLLRSWEASKAAHGQAVLIQGEAGIGKSRLVKALHEHVLGENHTWVAHRCSPYHANSTLYPVIQHLERVMGWKPEDGAEARLEKLEAALKMQSLPAEEAVPLYADLMSLPLPEGRYAPLGLSATEQRERTLDALAGWLLEKAEQTPMLQVWEDLHWADPTTLELLGLYIEQSPTVSMLEVLTYRPEFVPPWTMRSHMTPITLNRLERAEVEALTGNQAAGKRVPSEVVEHIVGKADGVPLYVEELTKTILESDYLHEEADRYTLVGSLSEIAIPATLQDSLMARLDRLPGTRELAQLGAVLGREFAYEMLQPLAEVEEAKLLEGLGQLVDAELLYQRGRAPRAKYIFKHALIQDAAYKSLLKRTRQRYHRQVAALMEERLPEAKAHPEVLAHHYTEAGLAELAVDHWHEAGKRAMQHSAHIEAEGHLRKGLAVLESIPEGQERRRREIALQNSLGVCLMPTRGFGDQDVAAAFSRAATLAEAEGDSTGLFVALRGKAQHQFMSGDLRSAREQVGRTLTLAQKMDNPDILMEAHHLGWSILPFTGDFDAARKHSEAGIALYDRDRHHRLAYIYSGHDPGVCCRTTGSLIIWQLGYADQALALSREGLSVAENLSHPFSLAMALWGKGMLHMLRRDASALRQAGELMIAHCVDKGIPPFIPIGKIFRGGARAAQGEFAEGIAELREGIAGLQASGIQYTLPLHYALLAEMYLKSSQITEGLTAIKDGLGIAEKTHDRFIPSEFLRLKAELLLAGREPAAGQAEAYLERALEIARSQGARLLELRAATSVARLRAETGNRAAARDILGPLCASFSEGLDTPDLIEAKTLLDELS